MLLRRQNIVGAKDTMDEKVVKALTSENVNTKAPTGGVVDFVKDNLKYGVYVVVALIVFGLGYSLYTNKEKEERKQREEEEKKQKEEE